MSHFKVNENEIFFILKDQLNYGSLCKLERYRELDEETLDMLVSEAIKFANGVVAPLQEVGEEWGVVFEDGQVRCTPEFREAFKRFGENGWIAVARSKKYGGQGFPHKMRINDAGPFKAYMKELEMFCRKNQDHPILGEDIRNLFSVKKRLSDVALKMSDMMQSDPLQWASQTYPALLCFGDVTIVWRLLDMALIAQQAMDKGKKNDFYLGKVMQATYYSGVTLPITMARLETCLRNGREIVEIPDNAF